MKNNLPKRSSQTVKGADGFSKMKWKISRASKDLIIVFVIFILVSVLVYFFGLFETFQVWIREQPLWEEWRIHDQLFLLIFVAISLGILSLRRWFDSKREIAERKRVEDLLKKLQAEQQIILDSVPAWIFYKDTENCFVRVNKTFADVMQMTKEQLEGKSCFDLYPKEQAEAFWRDDREVIASGEPKMNIIEPMDSIKGKLWVQTDKIPYRDIQGNIIGIIGFAIDITERKQAEESLKESYEFNSSLLRTIPFGMDIVDEEGSVLFQSENLQKLFKKEVIGKKCWELYRDDKTQCWDCPLRKEMKIGETDVREVQGVRGGKVFEISHTCMMFQGKKAILEIFIDITGRKQAELQIQKYTEELIASNATKDKFHRIIAHDLRSPFNGFLGMSEILVTEIDSLRKDEIKDLNKALNVSLRKQYDLLTDLLDWSRLQNKNFVLNNETVFLYKELNKVIEPLASTAKQKGIELRNNVEDDLTVYADLNMLKLVLRNLISNGIKFTNKSGFVAVSAVRNDPFQRNLRSEKKDMIVEITVSDNGVGIAEIDLEKLFRDDVRYSTEGTSKEQGTGLGLLLCKEIVEKHGGKIWVESEPGKGSKFIFTIPDLDKLGNSNKQKSYIK